jgi:NAD(P)-dependent dehydrogenase (short-subunit alcohol dehydrogenase family)
MGMSEVQQPKESGQSKPEIVPEQMLEVIRPGYKGAEKLKDRVAIITGGDSGIGKSVAVHYAKEGADIAIVYHESDDDANETKRLVEAEGRKCVLFKGDISLEEFCKKVVNDSHKEFGRLDILVNNAGTHEPDQDIKDISSEQFKRTFEVNMFSFFYFTREALNVLQPDGCIINTASVVAYRGSDHLIDYSATKGAIVSFTRSLSKNLASKGIRVNAVAPGPIWTPLVIESFDEEHLKKFGKKTPMERAGKPSEVAPAFVFLACEDASYITGQVIHVNGGEVVGG